MINKFMTKKKKRIYIYNLNTNFFLIFLVISKGENINRTQAPSSVSTRDITIRITVYYTGVFRLAKIPYENLLLR